jgi:hypothetical protein
VLPLGLSTGSPVVPTGFSHDFRPFRCPLDSRFVWLGAYRDPTGPSGPPMPFVPEEHHGRIVVMGLMAYTGNAQAGQRALAPFRALATPIADLLRPMPYPEVYPPEQPGFHPIASAHTMLVDDVERRTIETALERLETSDAMMRAVEIRALGGAMARVPADATALATATGGSW